MGLELHEGELTQGLGGGCCQVSNALYLLALRGGMKIVERHRHGIDLFPDHQRTVPFGCGATVFYNYADLRFENPLPQPVLCRFLLKDRHLISELWTEEDPGWTVEIYEVEHRFYCEDNHWMRENRLRRRFRRADGSILLDHEVAHNCGRVLYEPSGEQVCCAP
jgi:vancomycin resistance protein VanW